LSELNLQAGDINAENLWAEIKSAEAGWLSAVGFLAVYRLESSEKEIHFAVLSEANAKLALTSAIAFHNQPAEALFVVTHKFSGR
jgi:hypothetical protein